MASSSGDGLEGREARRIDLTHGAAHGVVHGLAIVGLVWLVIVLALVIA